VDSRDRAIRIVLGTYAVLVFAVLWAGLAIGLANGGGLFEDTWAVLIGLEVVAQVVLWVLLLPLAVGLWAWNAGLPPVLASVVVLGLVAWTLVAVAGLLKAILGGQRT
jgi:hypothetical protein